MMKNLIGYFAPNDFEIIWFSSILTLCVPDEGYSRNASCELKYICTSLLESDGQWTIQRHCQHWLKKTQDEDKQNILTQHMVSNTNPPESAVEPKCLRRVS
jgi:hypothetical protein